MLKLKTILFALALAGSVALASGGSLGTKQADHRHRHADQILRALDR